MTADELTAALSAELAADIYNRRALDAPTLFDFVEGAA
jgi:hypothetical protein